MRILCSILVVIAALSFGGCATITSSEMQQVAVTAATDTGQQIDGVRCALRNDKGQWEGTTPGFIAVHKSAGDLSIECKKDGHPDGLGRAISRVSGGMVGNIIFGGGIGVLIDHTKGTGYNYPDAIPVVMGRAVVVDRAAQQGGGQQPATTPATTPGQATAGTPQAPADPARAAADAAFERQRTAVSK